ncbi:MAG: CHASE2 domain-containing protein [Granulosicoccus sp.]
MSLLQSATSRFRGHSLPNTSSSGSADEWSRFVSPSSAVAWLSIALFFSLLAVTPFGERLERQFGLPLLFGVRNAIVPPVTLDDLFIVTPFKSTELEQPSLLRKWDRKRHARAIDQLVQLDVSVLAIDIFFRDPHPVEDEELARSLRSAPNTLLVQNVQPFTGALKGGIVEKPVPEIASAVSQLTLSQIPVTRVRNDLYALRAPILFELNAKNCQSVPDPPNDCSSLSTPSVGIEGVSDDAISQFVPTTVPTLPLAAFELWSSVVLRTDGSAGGEFSDSLPDRVVLRKGVPHLHLNLYGPPRTLPTLDYTELDTLADDVANGHRENPLEGSVVFIGGSFDSLQHQREDAYVTVFSSNEKPMSGVEMAATAFANLRQNNALDIQAHPPQILLSVLSILLPVFFFSRPTRTRRSIALVVFSASALLVLVSYKFASVHVWLPVITPLCALACVTTFILVSDLRTSNRLKDKARGELGTFVSDLIVTQLDSGRPRQLDQAVCLVSDVRGFTAMSEELSTEALHELNERYFSVLFDRVTFHGADVVKTYGDSMTAIWAGAGAQQRTRALLAARDILSHMNADSNSQRFQTTHIGLTCGPVVVGCVGVKQRRSVELTGGAVYRASRLEQLNKSMGTMMLASNEFAPQAGKVGLSIKDMGIHQLRGFSSSIRVVAVDPVLVGNAECAVA